MTDWAIMLHNKIIKRFSLSEGEQVSIGRESTCDITIDNTAISRQHVSLALHNGIYFISDLGSTNGTFVNSKKITSDKPVSQDDTIEFGKFILSVIQENKIPTKAPTSVATDMMDMDDETIFVNNQRPSNQKKQFKPKTSGPALKVLQGNTSPKEFSLAGKSSIKIGKDQSCDLRLKGWLIAYAQCYIIKRDQIYYLIPQKSWTGTFVNNSKITSEHTLRPGDIIKIRDIIIRFE